MEPPSRPVQPPVWTKSFVTVVTTQMAFGYASSAFVLLPKYLSTELHATASDIGHVTAVGGVAAVAAIPFVGAAIDRFGRKPLVVLGCVLTALYSFGWLGVHELGWLIYALQMLGGVAFMIAFNAAGTLVADQAPAERMGQAIGIFGASNMVMSAVAPGVGEVLAASVGWDAMFALSGGVALFALLLAQRIEETHLRASVPPRRAPEAAGGDGDDHDDAHHDQASVRLDSIPPMPGGLGLAATFALLRRQWPQSVAMATCGASYGAVSTFYQPHVIAQGAVHVSGFFIGFTIAAVAVRLLFGSLPDRVGRRRVSIGSYVVFASTVLLMTQLTPNTLFVFGFLFGCAHGVFYPALSALSVEQAGRSERGRAMTLVMGSFRLGNVISALLMGWVAEAHGFPAVFVLASLTCWVGVAALYAAPADNERAPRVGEGRAEARTD
jgi:MFS family permease